MSEVDLRVFADGDSLIEAAAQLFAEIAIASVAERGRFTVALSGGGTPQGLYQRLARPPYRDDIPWAHAHLYWGDERLVPPNDPGSNYAQAARTLIRHLPIPEENIHRAKGELSPHEAVQEYRRQLRRFLPPGSERFDLVLMGMGSDGHTASLFPGPVSPAESEEAVISVTAKYEGRPANRLTLTPLVFNNARNVVFLVAGANKAETLAAVFSGGYQPEKLPAQRIRPVEGRLIWLVDRAAARRVKPR